MSEERDWKAGCVSALILVPLSSVWSAWVVTRLWIWFVVPQFHMAPISLPVVVGLHCLFLMYVKTKNSEETDWLDLWLQSLLVPGLALGIGYVAHLFQ